nr:hypothetical protein [Comamonas koreensis]
MKSHTNNIATGRWALPFCIDEMRISISEILPTNLLERQDTLQLADEGVVTAHGLIQVTTTQRESR